MKFENYHFGYLTIDGQVIKEDLVIDRGKVDRRDKGPSKPLKAIYGHTPLTSLENIPWDCETLVIGTGEYGALPVTDDFLQEVQNRCIEVKILKTQDAVEMLNTSDLSKTNAVLHLTC